MGWLFGEFGGRLCEIPACLFVGSLLLEVSPGLGNFFILEAVALGIVLWVDAATIHARRVAIRDAEIRAGQMRNLRGGGSGW
jgi:hypothetical protein